MECQPFGCCPQQCGVVAETTPVELAVEELGIEEGVLLGVMSMYCLGEPMPPRTCCHKTSQYV